MAALNPKEGPEPQAKLSLLTPRSLQYCVNEKEYAYLHRKVTRKLPSITRRRLPPPGLYRQALKDADDYNPATVRASVRLFLALQAALKLYDFVITKVLRRGVPSKITSPRLRFWKSTNFRLSLSASLVLFFHRLLHRFLVRLRSNLLTPNAKPFRKRNPRVSKVLTSRLAPAVGASVAGYALVVAPNDDFRVVIAIYLATRAAEFGYNALETDGWFKNRPWWFGSWMLMPPVFGQLLNAFVFNRDCFPQAYGNFILRFTPNYVQPRPGDLPKQMPWPSRDEIVDGLATMSRLRYPSFVSPILFPDAKKTLPFPLENIAPITSSAHPVIRNMSCALLHPSEPSCLQTNLEYYVKTIPRLARFFAIVYAIFALPRYRKFFADPTKELNKFSKSVLLSTGSISASIGTAWGSICLFQSLLSAKTLPTQRWFWGGFLAGLWAFIEREHGRSSFLYSLRISMESLWKLGVKKEYLKPGNTGDVWLAVASLMLLNIIRDYNAEAITSGLFRRGLKLATADTSEVAIQGREERTPNESEKKS